MPRDRRRWEEPAPSHWDPGYGRSYGGEYDQRLYGSPNEPLPVRSSNYWRDEAVMRTSRYPQRSYERESYDHCRSWRAESSYSARRRNYGSARDWDDRDSSGDRSLRRRRYSTDAPPPYIPQPTFHARRPTETVPPFPKPVAPDPPRKASPPPNKPRQPSERYLSLSQKSSEVLQDPRISRKLLVLDLNGTLLIRSARSRVSSSGPQLRPVQPRPYMQTFRQYLFCPQTRAWLDTMIWSSAQPHSVDDMVEKVFGTTKKELIAVWNRKSLGLSEAEYHQKTVTAKDLTKPWNMLASALSTEKPRECSTIQSEFTTTQSAFTTLLLDDSPHKAVLQPYNHVCIPEYDSTRRQHDLQCLLATKGPKQNKKAKRKNQVETAGHSSNEIILELSPRGAASESAEKEPYDATLLAVIGILDAVRLQSNVAGWVRKGGLLAAQERWEEVGALDVKHHDAIEAERGKTASGTVAATGNDANRTSNPAVTPEQTRLQTKMWFDDALVLAYWVARGRGALMELGIQVIHGMTG